MHWVVLIFSGLMESVWAIALEKSQFFSNLLPTIVFLCAMILSMVGLSYATKTIPLGIAYAVWVGIGVAAIACYEMVVGAEPFSVARIALLLGLVCCIAGLKVTQSA